MTRMNQDGSRDCKHLGTYAQVTITVVLLGFLSYLVYVALTDDGMRNWIVATAMSRMLGRTLGVLVVSGVATFGLARSRRWAWWLAVVLDSVVVGRCVYELGWGEWEMWASGRVFTNAQDVAFGTLFLGGLICLLACEVTRHHQHSRGAVATKV
jgi:hypothetical protein